MKNTLALAAVLGVGAAAYLATDTASHTATGEGLRPGAQPALARAPSRLPDDAPPAATTATADGNSEVVLNVRVRKDRNCNVALNDYVTTAGEVFSAYSCTPRTPQPPHPYAHYDNGSLEVLAYADPEAAALLGRRLAASDRDKSYEMLVRAAALDGKVGHLAWLADQAYSTVRIDGALQVDNVKRRYELAALAARLGGDPSASQFLRDTLVDAGVNAHGIDRLDARVDQLLEAVHDIQRAVYGEIRYGGQTDA